MTHTPVHGRRHEIEFYEPPSGNEMLDGIAEVLCGPGVRWDGTHGIAFRCVYTSDDKRTYVIEEVDIWQSLLRKKAPASKFTKIVEITLHCNTCHMKYKVWRVVGDDWTQEQYWLNTDYCPACPPMSSDVWLAQLGYYPERPVRYTTDNRTPALLATTIDMTDFD